MSDGEQLIVMPRFLSCTRMFPFSELCHLEHCDRGKGLCGVGVV